MHSEKISTVKAPEHWECKQPNQIARDNALKIYNFIFKTHCLLPSVIAATIEEGIYFRYISLDKTTSLIIEILNDGFIVWLTNDDINKTIKSSGEFEDLNKLTEIIGAFNENKTCTKI